MNELFIPYELALLAKEKGFDEPCFAYYDLYGHYHFNISDDTNDVVSITNGLAIDAAPLYQQIVDWFREKHHIIIDISYDFMCYDVSVYDGDVHVKLQSSLKEGAPYCFTEYYDAMDKAIQEAFKLIP